MKSYAVIVKTDIGRRVMVQDRTGNSQWPILYDYNGRVGWDFPELVPQCTKDKAYKLLLQLKREAQ